MDARKTPRCLFVLRFNIKRAIIMSRLDGALWNVLCPTASPHVSLLFQARDKCLSITMVYYVCACIHGTPRTFLFTCVGKKAENIGRRPLSTSPQTCCPLVTSHCCSRDRLFMCKSTCNNHGVGCICLWLEGACCSSCCPVKKKKMKKSSLSSSFASFFCWKMSQLPDFSERSPF